MYDTVVMNWVRRQLNGGAAPGGTRFVASAAPGGTRFVASANPSTLQPFNLSTSFTYSYLLGTDLVSGKR